MSKSGPTSKLLSVTKVAERLGCSERTVYRLAGDGKMPRPVKLGVLTRWDSENLDEWVQAGCPTPTTA
ncbi:helix-turn-helix transcriptional regulator [Planctomycetes bacterium TBK1r]|uniref:Prophage CP4-57 regulatory protein (AlpA) n=1 Tax=Stieleria magnilauensis TaxID=2527963 RepID=A0ABX5XHH6_9BACT|nr:Prophage CP4-57 regulatory protein (AlpA) [Planctomycetes bacterium TBK1r]